jgi:hypothetical protein
MEVIPLLRSGDNIKVDVLANQLRSSRRISPPGDLIGSSRPWLQDARAHWLPTPPSPITVRCPGPVSCCALIGSIRRRCLPPPGPVSCCALIHHAPSPMTGGSWGPMPHHPCAVCSPLFQYVTHLASNSHPRLTGGPLRRSTRSRTSLQVFKPSLRFGKGGSEGPSMIGRERTGILSPNHMKAFRPSSSESGDWV